MVIDETIIQTVIDVAKRLDSKNMVNSFEGNVSIYQDGLLYITPSGVSKFLLAPDMIVVMDAEGNQIHGGTYKPSSELAMHRAVYQMQEGIGGVVHAHPVHLTAYAVCAKPIRSESLTEFLCDHKSIEVVPFGIPGSDDIYKGVKPILDTGRKTMLLANHGALSVGATIYEALNRMESAENAATMFVLTQSIGAQSILPDYELERRGVTYDAF